MQLKLEQSKVREREQREQNRRYEQQVDQLLASNNLRNFWVTKARKHKLPIPLEQFF